VRCGTGRVEPRLGSQSTFITRLPLDTTSRLILHSVMSFTQCVEIASRASANVWDMNLFSASTLADNPTFNQQRRVPTLNHRQHHRPLLQRHRYRNRPRLNQSMRIQQAHQSVRRVFIHQCRRHLLLLLRRQFKCTGSKTYNNPERINTRHLSILTRHPWIILQCTTPQTRPWTRHLLFLQLPRYPQCPILSTACQSTETRGACGVTQ